MDGPRRTWMNDIIEWTGLRDYGKVKIAAEEKRIWGLIVLLSTFVIVTNMTND